jgi:hypothetical protein
LIRTKFLSGSGRIVFAPNANRSGPQADPQSHLGLLRQFQGIVDLNADVPRGALDPIAREQ